jgi:hypothetical protein
MNAEQRKKLLEKGMANASPAKMPTVGDLIKNSQQAAKMPDIPKPSVKPAPMPDASGLIKTWTDYKPTVKGKKK